MDDLIRRQDAIDALDITPLEVHDYELAVGVIKDIPSAQSVDAVEVVRCKDCIHNQYGFCEKVNHNTGYVSTCADVLRAEKRENYG